MKHFLTILAVVSALASLCIFIAFIWILIAFSGNFNIVLPGLGLVISGAFVSGVLLIFGLMTLVLAVLLFRKIYRPLR